MSQNEPEEELIAIMKHFEGVLEIQKLMCFAVFINLFDSLYVLNYRFFAGNVCGVIIGGLFFGRGYCEVVFIDGQSEFCIENEIYFRADT